MPSVERATVDVIDRDGAGEALARLQRVAESSGVELVDGDDADIAIVLGGPVLVWGLEAMAVTFIAPHALTIRPLVIPRETDVTITNLTTDVETTLLVDGQPIGKLAAGERASVRVGEQHTMLATLPEVTFFTRYAATFGR